MSSISNTSDYGERLSDLLDGIAKIDGYDNMMINSLSLDSRRVKPGSLFFAVPGLKVDGRSHIESAIKAGAGAIIFESDGWQVKGSDKVPQIGVSNLSHQISGIADVFFKKPSEKLHVVGITGTNGKSSCAVITAQALDLLGHRCGIVGTLGWGFSGCLKKLPLTTPDSISLQHHLAKLADKNADYICLEVSSHSLDQSRTDGVRFGTVVFTNLSQDHLDYHGTMEHYRSAKSKLFTKTASSTAVLNIDDDFGRSLVGRTQATREISYGTDAKADVRLTDCLPDVHGLNVSIRVLEESIEIRSQLLGRVNGINLTAAAAILHSLGTTTESIEEALHSVTPITGRLVKIRGSSRQASVFIDFAHTPDSLQQALTSVREVTEGDLWCVFGCGGDRDVGKRPLMGKIAERNADRVIITDDNPRTESPAKIVADIASGMQKKPLIEHDRERAIELAIAESAPGDSILIAGKGHETEQIYANQRLSFSDQKVAEEFLRGSVC